MLTLDGVRKTFNPGTANEVRALAGVNLEFAPGSLTVVIGTNGSGKSTLQGAIAGAFALDAGRIVVDGTDITKWPEHRRAHVVGRVFQDPFAGTASPWRRTWRWPPSAAGGARLPHSCAARGAANGATSWRRSGWGSKSAWTTRSACFRAASGSRSRC